jgi:hypothetical protein
VGGKEKLYIKAIMASERVVCLSNFVDVSDCGDVPDGHIVQRKRQTLTSTKI